MTITDPALPACHPSKSKPKTTFSPHPLVLLILCGFALFSAPLALESTAAQASGRCIENGGDYVGCVKPLGFRWETSDGNFHSTLEGAARAGAAYATSQMSSGHYYNLGLQTGSVAYSTTNSNCSTRTDYIDSSFTNLSSTDSVGSNSSSRIRIPIHLYGRAEDHCGGLKHYSTTWGEVYGWAVCPAGYRSFRELTAAAPTYGYMCVPGKGTETNVANARKNTELSCQDTVGSAGQASTGMPVNIATRCKTQSVRDIQTPGPWPLGWDRYIAQDSQRDGWLVGLGGNLTEGTRSDGFAWAGVRRPWGQFLLFKASPNSGSTREWQSGMENAPVFQSRLKDVWAGGSLSHWELTQVNGETETYSSEGKLIRRRSPDGFHHHYFYDTKGRIEQAKDDFGHQLTLTYIPQEGYSSSNTYAWEDEDGNPATHTSSFNPDWQGPASQSLPETISDGARAVGYSWSMVLNGNGPDFDARLDKVLWGDGTERTYVYGELVNGKRMASWALSGEIDEEGRRIRTYEPTGQNARTILREWKAAGPDGIGALERLTINTSSVVDQDGRSFSFTKGTSATHSSNRIRAYSTPCPECGGVQGSQLTYNTNGFLTQVKDWRNVLTVMDYDTAGRMTSLTQAHGTPFARTTAFTYPIDPSLREPLTQTEQVMDAAGVMRTRTTTYTYSMVPITYGAQSPCLTPGAVTCAATARKMVSVLVEVNDGSAAREWTTTYNAQGLRHTITDPAGLVTQWTWTTDGQVASVTRGHGTSASYTVVFGGHGAWGPTWQQSPNGLVARWARDQRGRIIREEVGLPGPMGIGEQDEHGAWSTTDGTWRVSQMEWRDNGLLHAMTSPGGVRLEFSYNGADKPTAITAKENLGVLMWTKEMTWSLAGLLTGVSTRDASNTLVLSSTQTIDALQRVASLVDSRSHTTALGYDANGSLTSTETPLGAVSSQGLDVLGRPTTLTGALSQVATLTYGPQDETRTATDQRGVQTTYAYNGFGDLVEVASPDRGTWGFTYDASGRRLSMTDPRGVVANYSHDALGRVVGTMYSDDGVGGFPSGFLAGDVAHSFDYDSCTNGKGRLCSVTDSTGTTAYSYNAWGEVASKTWTGKAGGVGAGITLSTGYGYDSATGQLTTVSLPSGKVLAISYGPDGKPSALNYGIDGVVANIQWTAFDAVKGWTWPMSVGWSGVHSTVRFDYDLDGRPVAIEDLHERELVWDPASRLIAVDDTRDVTKTQLYDYDPLDRLTSADIGAWMAPQTYGYDAVGNRTSRTDDATGNGWNYAYGLSHNRQMSRWPVIGGTPGTAYASSYDAMGNLVTDGMGLSLAYDATGRLVQGSKGLATQTSGYNALGQRVSRTVVGGSQAGTQLYAYDEQGRPLGAYAPDSSEPTGFRVVEEYVHLDGWRPVAVVRPSATSGMVNPDIHPILTDHLGTPRKVLDSSTGLARWDWDAKEPFGHQAPNQAPTAGLPAFTFDLRFPGQRYDEATGLFQNGFRDYHAGLGRYVQSDPLGLEAGWNTYGYVESIPLSHVDPFGLRVYLAFHEVAAGVYHSKIVVTGSVYGPRIVFGGGPDGRFITMGSLHGGEGRPGDIDGPDLLRINLSGNMCLDETVLVDKLRTLTNNYNRNHASFWTGTPYALFPSSKFFSGAADYNSNSYARGLGEAAGLQMPERNKIPFRVPGYIKPVPAEQFK